METIYGGEKQKKCSNKFASESNKIDLALKLSPFGDEKKEERRSKLEDGNSLTILPCLNKPSSLLSEEAGKDNDNGKDEDKRVVPEKRKRYRVTVNGAKFFQVKALLNPPSENSNHQQGGSIQSHLVDGLNLNNNASTTKQNYSMASYNTEVKGIDLNTNVLEAKQNDSLASKKTTNEKAEGLHLNTNSSTSKQSDTTAPKKTTNTDKEVEGLDLNTNASAQSDSLTSKKTTMKNEKGFDLNTNASTTYSITSKKTTREIGEGLNLKAKQNRSLAFKKRMNAKAAKGLDLNKNPSSSHGEQNDSACCKKTEKKDESKRFKLENYCSLKGDVMEILRRMPNVTTVGEGPNGQRVEGFLYKYMNSQVCIVCVCHGNFLTPAEFVMHAGGIEVEDPMKKITVYFGPF
ncbi:hypothetical protein PIB30_072852 [Stylosanthes scabra]|uniref:Ninja-family protein n=1 Tax=Stylosanthes scabra TaxID=79078 RepID=A0ABU6YLS8_9FABA|nr:hypothetical protein [Stylosanthes scabra]